jgi:hypothetical protein
MRYNEWKLLTESLQGSMNLGLARPHVVGGPIGAYYAEDFDDDDENTNDEYEDTEDDGDDDFDFSDKDEDGGEEEYGDNLYSTTGSDKGRKGNLSGAANPKEGHDKSWPPDDFEKKGRLSTPDKRILGGDEDGKMNDLTDMGKPVAAQDVFNGNSMDTSHAGDQGDDMGFLQDIDPKMAGFDQEDDLGGMNDDMGGDLEDLDSLDTAQAGDASMGEPCPNCNADGEFEDGEKGCKTCQGLGFLDAPKNDLDAKIEDEKSPISSTNHMSHYMDLMNQYMARYMKKENVAAPASQMGTANPQVAQQQQTMTAQQATAQQQQAMAAQQQAMTTQQDAEQQAATQQQIMRKKMVRFMSKKGERSFMAKDEPRKKKDYCHCEGQDAFFSSLANQARGNVHKKNKSGLQEDVLFSLVYPDDVEKVQAGQVGFAPQGRIGSIGGGYTQEDIKDIPILGESCRFPTLAEYARMKAKKKR